PPPPAPHRPALLPLAAPLPRTGGAAARLSRVLLARCGPLSRVDLRRLSPELLDGRRQPVRAQPARHHLVVGGGRAVLPAPAAGRPLRPAARPAVPADPAHPGRARAPALPGP